MRSRKFRLIMAAVCVALILCTALLSSLIQTSGGRVEIIQVTDQSNIGFKTITAADTGKEADYAVNGHVASGLLYATLMTLFIVLALYAWSRNRPWLFALYTFLA